MSDSVFSLDLVQEANQSGPRAGLIAKRLAELVEKLTAVLQDEREKQQLLFLAEETRDCLDDMSLRIQHLENLSTSDELTGLANRRGFNDALDQALARAARYGETGILILCDLDYFKEINDRFGHMAGDQALREIARRLRESTRRGDCVARLGGDEFAILMPSTSPNRAIALERKLRDGLKREPVFWYGQELEVSGSFGFHRYDGETSAEELINAADKALYDKKRCRKQA